MNFTPHGAPSVREIRALAFFVCNFCGLIVKK